MKSGGTGSDHASAVRKWFRDNALRLFSLFVDASQCAALFLFQYTTHRNVLGFCRAGTALDRYAEMTALTWKHVVRLMLGLTCLAAARSINTCARLSKLCMHSGILYGLVIERSPLSLSSIIAVCDCLTQLSI